MLSSQKEARQAAQEVPQLIEPVSETERAHLIRFVSVLAESQKH